MGELPHHHEDRKRLERLRSFIQEPESFQEVANLCRLLSDNSRVRIFWLLCHCEECVMNLSALVGMSSPAASHHLRQLKDSGLIVSRRVGKEVYYRAADTEVAQLLHQIIERTVEVTCPQSDSQLVSGAPHLPPLDQHDYCGSCPAEQLKVTAGPSVPDGASGQPHHHRAAVPAVSHEPLHHEGTVQGGVRQLHRRPYPPAPHGAGLRSAAGERRQRGSDRPDRGL